MEINWELVYEKLVGSDDPFLFNHEEVAEVVFKVYKRFAEKDFQNGRIEGIETYYKFDRDGYETSGIIDLWGRDAAGDLFISDWKTTGSFTDSWIFRESASDQSLQYVHGLFSLGFVEASFPVKVHIRGITRSGSIKSLPVRIVQAEDLAKFDLQQAQWAALYAESKSGGWNNSWAQNKPDGCTQFGYNYLCPFSGNGCGDHIGGIDQLKEPRLSHSFLKNYKRCPEYARLLTIKRQFDTIEEESDELMWGLAFHRGIAEVYRQMKEGI